MLAATCALAVASGSASVALSTPPTDHPPLGLPFAPGEQAKLLAGPHRNNVHDCGGPGAPCNSLDFVPKTGEVAAAGPGVVQQVPGTCLGGSPPHQTGLVVIKHTTGGQPNGWWTGYYHLRNIRVKQGGEVDEGTPIGDIGQTKPCGGTKGPEAHVHFFLKYAPPGSGIGDPFLNTSHDVDLQGIVLGGWKVTKTAPAEGCMTYVKTGEKRCSPSGIVTNYALQDCKPITPMKTLQALNVDCDSARDVAHRWGRRTDCRPDGTHCQVLGYDCFVPSGNNFSDLRCAAGKRLITGKLEPY